MSNVEAKQRIDFLRTEILKHDELYDLGRPIIGDGEYDVLYRELVELEARHPEFHSPDSPTQKIIHVVVDGLEQVRHTTFMGSQEKIHDWDGVTKFTDRVKSGDNKVLGQYKLDGLTGVIRYQDGKLSQGVTRGDGEVGDDITHNVRTIKNLPKYIPFMGYLEVRAEIIIPYAEFNRINDEIENPEERYSNPRNLASGTARQLDASIASERNMQAIVFDLVQAEGMDFDTDEEQLEFLRQQGFDVVETKVFSLTKEGLDELSSFIEIMGNEVRKTLPYMIDGLIIKNNSLGLREELGGTSKHPKWSVAFKFASQEATTKILDVTPQVGKTGAITPVWELETVNIEGVNVSRATAHNYGRIRLFDIRIGDTVTVIRANDVIPKVTNALHELRTGEEQIVVAPEHCPECGSKTVFENDLLYCTGTNCRPQLQGKLEHFGSRKALNIDGLGDKTVELFFNKGFINSFTDLYRLQEKEADITSMDGFGKRKFEKLLKGLEDAKKAPLNKVIYALSIRHVGESSSKDLADVFGSMRALLDASLEIESFTQKILSLPDFGEQTASSLVTFFSNQQNRQLIEELLSFGFTMEMEKREITENAEITGKTFVITGELSKSRDEFKTLIESMGGKVSGSVSKKTNYLLMGPDAEGTSKHQKAVELSIPILLEADFNTLIG